MLGIPGPGTRIGRFTVGAEIGRGGMAVVLEVFADGHAEALALKLLLPGADGAEGARRLRREFRALSRLDHPGVLRVYEAGVWEGRPWFVMERLRGRTLRDEVETWREVAPAERARRARSVLVQLAQALDYVHARGLVHRDVTPANIMMLEDGRAKLMDFGVVKEPGAELTSVGEVVGTVAYIAPEQIHGGRVDARADLYSLGAVYYLCLTGKRPFHARTLAGIMDKHLHVPVRPPRELVPTLPAEADAVCVRLLAKDPADRFASATHLLHALHAADEGGVAPGAPGWTPPLVGRTAEVAAVRAAVARLGAGAEDGGARGGVLVLEGGPGMGLRRMGDEAVRWAQRMGLEVSRGENRDRTQDVFDGFKALYEDLLREAGGLAPPALAATFGRAAGGPIERYAVMAGLGAMLARSKPRVVLLEQMERADRGTIEMAEYLVRNLVGAEHRPILFVFARAQAERDGGGDGLDGLWTGTTTGVAPKAVELGPLDLAPVEELLLSVFDEGPAVRALARRVHAQSQGNPFVIGEILRALLERLPAPAGRRRSLPWSADEVAALELPVPAGLRELIRARLAPLSPDARRVALALAVSRYDLDFDLLGPVTALPEAALDAALNELLHSRLVEASPGEHGERYRLDRTRVGAVLLDETPPAAVEALHLAVAESLESAYKRRTTLVVEDLAHHFDRGGRPGKAFVYLHEAAEKLSTRTFVSEALRLLDRAAEIEPQARQTVTLDDADRRLVGLHLARATALLHLGQVPESEAAARAAHALAEDLGDKRLIARTSTEMGGLCRRTLRLDEADAHLRRALELAEGLGDKRLQLVPLYEYGAVLWTRGDLEAARDHFVLALSGSEAYEDERSRALGTNGLGLIALCRGQSGEARRYFQQAIEIAEKHGMTDRLAVARANLIEVLHLTGNLRKALELADRAVAHGREVHHSFGIGLGLRHRAMVLTDIGRLADAVDNAEEAVRIEAALGSSDDVMAARVALLRARLAQKQSAEARAVLELVEHDLDDCDAEGYTPVVLAWRARVEAETGHPEAAREALRAAHRFGGKRWPHQQVRALLALARTHETLGEADRAVALAEEALRVSDSAGFRLYAMRARQIAARAGTDEISAGRHARVADALARSLAAGLAREDAAIFLDAQGVKRRPGFDDLPEDG